MGEQFLEGNRHQGADKEASNEIPAGISLFDALAEDGPDKVKLAQEEPAGASQGKGAAVAGAYHSGIRLAQEISGPKEAATATFSDRDGYGSRSAFSKVVDITGSSIANAPGMYLSELKTDFTERPGKVLTTAGISTGAGFGMTYLLKKAPGKGKVALLGLAAIQAVHYGSRLIDFVSDAAGAENIQERDNLVLQGSLGLAREGTLMTEAAPGIILGGKLAVNEFGKPPLFESVENGMLTAKAKLGDTSLMRAARETSAGQALSRYRAFHGRGVVELPPSVKIAPTAEVPYTRVNLIAIDDAIGGTRANQFRLFEEARSIDVLKLRASKKIVGSAQKMEVDMGFADRLGHIRQHTHRPGKVLPSMEDVQSTRHLGIIHSGEKTTFYVGKAAEFEGLAGQATGFPVKPALPVQGITLDRTSRTATLFESIATPDDAAVGAVTKQAVDFDKAVGVLSEMDLANPWAQIKLLRGGS